MRERGQSLFEVVLALAVVSLVLIVLVAMASVSIRNASFARNKTLANRHTQKAIEWLRSERDAGWSAFYGRSLLSGQVWCINADPPAWPGQVFGLCSSDDTIGDSIFTRKVTLLTIDTDTIQAEVDTFWIDGGGEHHAKSSTVFTNWKAQ